MDVGGTLPCVGRWWACVQLADRHCVWTRTLPAAPVLYHRGSVLLSLPVSGLPGLNLLDALSAVIAERARGWGADVTWSAGCRLGNYVGQLLDCLGLRKAEGRGIVVERGEGETSKVSGHGRGRGRDGCRGSTQSFSLTNIYIHEEAGDQWDAI